MPVLHRLAALLAVVPTLLLGGCETETAVTWPPVTIADATLPWDEHATPRVLEARVEAPDGDWTIEDVYVRHTRHWWPGAAGAHEAVAEPVDAAGGLWRAVPAQATGADDADVLLWQWFVDYRIEGGEETLTASSVPAGERPHRMVIGCTEEEIAETLEQVRRVMNDLQPVLGELGDNPDYAAAAHFLPVSLEGQGVPYARQSALPELYKDHPDIDRPELVLYAPRGQGQLTDDVYRALVTDEVPDPPYRVLGVAYGVVQKDARDRPRLGCVPSDEWFIHEAGFHTPEGGFMPAAVDESVPGESVISGVWPPLGSTEIPPPINSVWHPRIWDLHFWLTDGSARPLAIFVPGGRIGLPIPPGTFFRPQTFE